MYNATVEENLPVDSSVITVRATDNDTGMLGNELPCKIELLYELKRHNDFVYLQNNLIMFIRAYFRRECSASLHYTKWYC